MSQPYLGQIIMFGGNFAISGWAACSGQLMAISQNAALFAILGTTFGGNGTSTFGIPDLRSRVPVGMGQGLGLSSYVLGEQTGTENVTILYNNMPSHSHLVNAVSNTAANNTKPSGLLLAQSAIRQGIASDVYSNAASDSTLAANAIQSAGGNVPIAIIQPVLCVNFLIALVGVFPTRN